MKKIVLIILSILIVLALGTLGYVKYTDYRLNQDIKRITDKQNEKEENEVINDYTNLLSKYNNNSKIYSQISSYYVDKDKINKAIDTLYLGLDKNKNNKLLINGLAQNIKNAELQDGYLRVNKGSSINADNKISISAKNGINISLKLDIDFSKIDTSKEGFNEIQGKEEYTNTPVKIGVEVLEFTGNTMSNNLSGGAMVFNEGWIYFRDPSSKLLYKMKEDLSNKTKLNESMEPCYLNIKDNSIYFIDSKDGQYGSLVKTDLDGKNKQVIRQNTCYVYIVGENIYYTQVIGQHSGWLTVSLNKMNFKYEDLEKDITTNSGFIKVINNKYICSDNKYGGFISTGKNNPTWGDYSNYKRLTSAEVYKGQIYGNTADAKIEKMGFGKLDIEHNTQSVTIQDVGNFNCIGKDVYYVTDEGIFISSIDGTNKVKLMDVYQPSYKITLYNIGNKIYSYSDEVKIVEKEKQEVGTNIPDISNEEITAICNKANKLFLNIQDSRDSQQIKNGSFTYASLKEPYSNKEQLKNELSKYFTKSYIERFLGDSKFIEKDGKLYFMVGDSGIGSSYKYTSIKSRDNKDSSIHAISYANYEFDNSVAKDADIRLKVEFGKWKIENFHSIFE
jgi:hypothetical protein